MTSGKLKLAELDNQKLVETTRGIVAWQAELRAAMFNSIGADDVQQIVAKQVEMAKAGKESAAKFILTHVLGTQNPIKIHQTNVITDVEGAARIAKRESA